MKRCTRCGESKPESEFYRKGPDGRLAAHCKQCKAAYTRGRNAEANAKRRARSAVLKAEGICVRCGRNPTDPEISNHTCEACLEHLRGVAKRYRKAARDELFRVYGGKVCACCGETEELFLAFDHINEDGAQHRLSMGKRSNGYGFSDVVSLHRALKKDGFPPVIQVLCHNCNHGKHLNGGVCPHQQEANQK
jgi:hypothetical protein